MTRATAIFQMLQEGSERTQVRREFACPEFGRVRRGMRTIIGALLEGDSSTEETERLRYQLFAWLTTPLPFSDFASDPLLAGLGGPSVVGKLWGRDVMTAYVSVLEGLAELRTMHSPLRAAVEDILVSTAGSGASVRVFCQRSARPTFTSMYSWAELEQMGRVGFLHTPRDYRIAEPFDVLIKIGPLRRTGYSSLTGAVLNAPRYRSLQQFTWSGLPDDKEFGRDPLLSVLDHGIEEGSGRAGRRTYGAALLWKRSEVRSGMEESSHNSSETADELTLFARPTPQRAESRAAVLVQIGTDIVVMYPPNAEVITLQTKPSGAMEVAPTTVHNLTAESFLAWPAIGAVDLGRTHATDGAYSATWKSRLIELLVSRPIWLESELRSEGLNLRHLRSCLENWTRPASSVIHAPQQQRHFEILIRVLGIGYEPVVDGRALQAPWWLRAWAEIARSRGHAVQVGMHEQEIIHSELMAILDSVSDFLVHAAEAGRTFTLPLSRAGLEGHVTFYHIDAVESGYRVPEAVLRTIVPLDRAYEWRV